jgi:hypothetical protein
MFLNRKVTSRGFFQKSDSLDCKFVSLQVEINGKHEGAGLPIDYDLVITAIGKEGTNLGEIKAF